MIASGLALAVLASVAINSGYLLQHGAAPGGPPITPRHPWASVRPLLASPAWVAGLALGCTGWGMHVGALSLAPLSLVQAFYAGGLALVAPLAAVVFGHRLARGEWHGVLLMAGALALLSVGLGTPGRHGTYAPAVLAAFLAVAGGGALAAVAAPGTRRRPAALGLAAGILYGGADTAIKALTEVVHRHGAAALLVSPWLAAALLGSAGAFFAFQRGLQIGGAIAVIALTTASTILVSEVGGLVVFGDPLGGSAPVVAAHVAAFAAVAVASYLLAPFQVRT